MHYNVQVHIQQVEQLIVPRGAVQVEKTERQVTSVLELKITAPTEAEAYERAVKILTINQLDSAPDFTLADSVAHRPL